MRRLAILVVLLAGCSKYDYSITETEYWGPVRVRTDKSTGHSEYLIPEGREILPDKTGWVSQRSFKSSELATRNRYVLKNLLKTRIDKPDLMLRKYDRTERQRIVAECQARLNKLKREDGELVI